MTDETDLLPLPEWMSNYTIPADGFECDKDVMLVDRMHDYARANVAHATAPLQAEIDVLRAERDALRDALREVQARIAAIGYPASPDGKYNKNGEWTFSDAVPRAVDAEEVEAAFLVIRTALAAYRKGGKQ